MKILIMTFLTLILFSQNAFAGSLVVKSAIGTNNHICTSFPYTQQVIIPKRHWWQHDRIGYVQPSSPCAQCGTCCEPVLIPKKYFWEVDWVQLLPVRQ